MLRDDVWLEGLATICGYFGNLQFTTHNSNTWREGLDYLEPDVFLAACKRLGESLDSWPYNPNLVALIRPYAAAIVRERLEAKQNEMEKKMLTDGSKPPQGGLNSAMMEEVERIRKAKQMGGR